MTGLPGTKGLTGNPIIFQDHEGGWAADANAYGSHGLGAVHRFLSGRHSHRQRVAGPARENLGHPDRRRGEQPWSVHLVKRCFGLSFHRGGAAVSGVDTLKIFWWFACAPTDGSLGLTSQVFGLVSRSLIRCCLAGLVVGVSRLHRKMHLRHGRGAREWGIRGGNNR